MLNNLMFGVGLSMTIGVGVLSYLVYNRYRQNKIPTKWRRIGRLASLRLYPLRSGVPLALHSEKTQINCYPKGLRLGAIRDQGLFLVNESSSLVTLENYPRLSEITSEITGLTRITFKAPKMEPIELDFMPLLLLATTDEFLFTSLMKVGSAYDSWFSRALLDAKTGLTFMYWYDDTPSCKKEDLATDTTVIGDNSSYLFMNLDSLEEIGARSNVIMNSLNFRTNFDIRMDKKVPFDEDSWKWMKIGEDAIFHIACACMRCKQRHPITRPIIDGQHLECLRDADLGRNHRGSALAKHMGLRRGGAVKLNDIVYVQDY